MQKTDNLALAEKAFRARNFSKVISLLEPQIIEYKENFRFYYLLGVSCMYRNDFGGAESYLSRARRIKLNSSDLMVAQAALFLYRGDIPRAVEYYLEVLGYAPSNKTAKKALKYIKEDEHQVLDMMIQFKTQEADCLFTDFNHMPFSLRRLKKAYSSWLF